MAVENDYQYGFDWCDGFNLGELTQHLWDRDPNSECRAHDELG